VKKNLTMDWVAARPSTRHFSPHIGMVIAVILQRSVLETRTASVGRYETLLGMDFYVFAVNPEGMGGHKSEAAERENLNGSRHHHSDRASAASRRSYMLC
jgi:hypothetical protein